MRKLSTVVVAAVSALLATAPLAQATPAPLNVVALGDSYGSGVGAGDYQPGTEGNCWRSNNSYSETIVAGLRASGKQVSFSNVTCSGAETTDLRQPFKGQPPQFDALKSDTNVVLLSIGTNDVDFAAYGGQCIQADCTGAPTKAILDRLPGMGQNVYGVLSDIKARSPQAKIVLTAYGRQLTTGANASDVTLDPICGPQVFTSQERVEGNDVASKLDLTLRFTAAAARKNGVNVAFVSPYSNSFDLNPTFEAHSLCDSGAPFYRGFDALAPGQEGQEAVLHLNRPGQAALAGLVRQKVTELAS